MSLNRYAARVDANQPDLVKLARELGWKLWNIKKPCDWLGLHRGVWWPIEIKMPGKGFTEAQEKFLEDIEPAGGMLLVWRTDADVIASTEAK